jgi:D-alanyl-D-alanine dipeptidase
MEKIPHTHLIFLDECERDYPVRVDCVYAQPNHTDNHFGAIYHPKARMLGHRDLIKIILLAAVRLNRDHGWTLILKDCLRVTEAQEIMTKTDLVKANPHWLIEPRFLSSAGQGGHPRGMAIDVGAVDNNNNDIDFGTRFDYFSSSTDVSVNMAHRLFASHSDDIKQNRVILETALVSAAKDFEMPLYPLPHEWWDFRFTSDYTNKFEPLSDIDLNDGYKMMTENIIEASTNFDTMEYIRTELNRFI